MTAELFAITYTRYQSAQISLRFVYRGVFTGGDSFVRYLGLFLYSTEWYFEPVARISAHLKLFRKILFRNILICCSRVVAPGLVSNNQNTPLHKNTNPQLFEMSREQRSESARVTGIHLHSRDSTLKRSKHTQKYRQNGKAPKIFFAPVIR